MFYVSRASGKRVIAVLVYPKLNQAKPFSRKGSVNAIRSVFVSIALLLFGMGVHASADSVTVSGASVNVRAVADSNGEIVGQVSKGDVLSTTGNQKGDWLEISPPAGISVWLYGELVREGAVAALSVRVRSGPGIGYRPVGTLSKGTHVSVLETRGDWLRIDPPSACTVWVSSKYMSSSTAPSVSVSPAVLEKPAPPANKPPANKPAVIVRTRPAVTVRTPPPPKNPLRKVSGSPRDTRAVVGDTDPLPRVVDVPDVATTVSVSVEDESVSGLKLVSGAPQGQTITVSGVLRASGFFPLRRPSAYRLVVKGEQGPSKTGCYAIGKDSVLKTYLDTQVTLVGKKYWVQGVREPVVIISELRQ
jgi:uncharacterized protein YgiM (DUF1202 family)